MPKTKLQNVCFSILMVAVMVYGMVCYNITITQGEMTNQVFILALGELFIMFTTVRKCTRRVCYYGADQGGCTDGCTAGIQFLF